MIDGFALIDKDGGWTSHDVVARLRRQYGQRRVGHAGTLDPMATGVLVVGLGAATRLLRFVQGLPKTYEATIRLGQATVTDDAEGEITDTPGWEWDPAGLSAGLRALTGEIQQVPSAVSAVKVKGVRAYARVRAGEDVDLAARPVTVAEFTAISAPRPVPGAVPVVDVDVRVRCSSGTYVRALARDLGLAVGSAGHLTALRRVAIGPITDAACTPLGEQAPPVVAIEMLLGWVMPVLPVDAEQALALRNGRRPALVGQGVALVVDADGRWVSVVDIAEGTPSILVNAPH